MYKQYEIFAFPISIFWNTEANVQQMNMKVKKLSTKSCDSQKQMVMQGYSSKQIKHKEIKFRLCDCNPAVSDYAP